MASTDKELEQQLEEAGNKLVNPPPSVDELLPLLDQVESFLSRVEQSPTKSMQTALAPSQNALITDQLFRHSDVDVKVAVAACISEITRITAPEAPYDDEQMKLVFQLIVSSFENLDDKSSRSYAKRTSILETVAKVRSCVVMLDLECDALIVEMFQKFLKCVRDYHPENVVSSMDTIMSLVLEESEEYPTELLAPLLASVKKGNQEVLPVARKLAEKVLKSCSPKIKPDLLAAVKALQTSLDDYCDVVASMCENVCVDDIDLADKNKVEGSKPDGVLVDEAVEANKEVTAGVGPSEVPDSTGGKSSRSVVSNGVVKTRVAESLAESDSLKNQEEGKAIEHTKSTNAAENTAADVSATEKVAKKDSRPEQSSRKRGRKVNSSAKLIERAESKRTADEKEAEKLPEDKSHDKDAPTSPHADQSASGDAAVASGSKLNNDIQPSSPKAVDGESLTASPSMSESPVDETLAKKVARLKKKEGSVKELVQSTDGVQKRAAEGTSDSEAKRTKRAGKKATSTNDKSLKITDTSKKDSGRSELDTKRTKQSAKADDASKNAEGSSLKQSEDKNRRARGKSVSGKNVAKNSPKDDDDENISSLKATVKQVKDEDPAEETPKTSSKRKRDAGKSAEKEAASDAKAYGEEIVGSRVQVYWPQDRKFYKGTVESYDAAKKKHLVVYDDGDEEVLNMRRQRFKFITGESGGSDLEDEGEATIPSSPDASSELPVRKKAKPEQSAKKEKMDASPKRGGGASSKSKSAAAGGKSGRKSKEVIETDGEDSKASKKAEDDSGAKNKEPTLKSGAKSGDAASSKTPAKSSKTTTTDDAVAVASKATTSTKSKDDGGASSSAKLSKSKQAANKKTPGKSSSKVVDSPKTRAPKAGRRSKANGTGRPKTGSAKAKDTEMEDNSDNDESGKEEETLKEKPAAKGQGSESKTGKKRLRAG